MDDFIGFNLSNNRNLLLNKIEFNKKLKKYNVGFLPYIPISSIDL